jgi:hypothetical protein
MICEAAAPASFTSAMHEDEEGGGEEQEEQEGGVGAGAVGGGRGRAGHLPEMRARERDGGLPRDRLLCAAPGLLLVKGVTCACVLSCGWWATTKRGTTSNFVVASVYKRH